MRVQVQPTCGIAAHAQEFAALVGLGPGEIGAGGDGLRIVTSRTPCRRSRKGRTSTAKVTKLATGLPGSPRKCACPTRPQAKGLPGLMAICHRSRLPSACTAGLMWSSSPTDTPAAGEHHVVPGSGFAQRSQGGFALVGHLAQVGQLAAQALHQCAQKEAVAV
jgi:hypothetical protein